MPRPPEREIFDQTRELPRLQIMTVFCTVGIIGFIATLDTTCVSTAMPHIAADLNAGASVTWVGTAMLVASTTAQVVVSRLSDIFGRKSCLQVSLFLMALGNLLCGFAQSAGWLYAARGIAGLGAGGIINLSLIVLSDIVSLRDRGTYMSLMGIPTALGLGLGPEIGGALADSGPKGWRWAFWITVPFTAFAMPVIWLCLPLTSVPGSVRSKLASVDWAGSALATAAFVLLLVPISAAGTSFAWSSAAAIAMLTVGGCVFLSFLAAEHFAPLPAIPLRLFRIRTVALVLGGLGILGIAWFGNFYIAPLYFQNVLGYSATLAGVLMLPLLLGQIVFMMLAGWLVKRTGRSRSLILVGYAIFLVGQGMQVAWPEKKSPGAVVLIVASLLVQSVGFGLTSQTTLVLAQASCAPADRAVITGMRNVTRNTGGAVGLALATAIINSAFTRALPTDLPAALDTELRRNGFSLAALARGTAAGLSEEMRQRVVHAYYLGVRDVFIMYVPVVGVCLLLMLGTKDTQLAETQRPQDASEQAAEMTAQGQQQVTPDRGHRDASDGGHNEVAPVAVADRAMNGIHDGARDGKNDKILNGGTGGGGALSVEASTHETSECGRTSRASTMSHRSARPVL